MTSLASIQSNHLALTCRLCGHSSAVAVADIPDSIKTVSDAAQAARCGQCGVKGQVEFRIIYVGGSWGAMDGSRQT